MQRMALISHSVALQVSLSSSREREPVHSLKAGHLCTTKPDWCCSTDNGEFIEDLEMQRSVPELDDGAVHLDETPMASNQNTGEKRSACWALLVYCRHLCGLLLVLWRDGPGVVHVVRRPGRRVAGRGLRRRVRLVAVEWCCWPSFGGGHYSPVRVPLMVSCSSSCLCLLAYHRVSS